VKTHPAAWSLLTLLVLSLLACTPRLYLWPTGKTLEPGAEVVNQAAVFCEQNGGRSLTLRSIGYCLFPDRSACEENAFLRAQCEPGQNPDFI